MELPSNMLATTSSKEAPTAMTIANLPQVEPGATTGVSGAIKERASWTGLTQSDPTIGDARLLKLQLRPASGAANALVSALTSQVERWEAPTRKRGRGANGRAKLRTAMGGVIGGLLGNWGGSAARYSYRVRSK